MGKTIGILVVIVLVVVAIFVVIGFTGGTGTESNSNTAGDAEANLNSDFLEESEATNAALENTNTGSLDTVNEEIITDTSGAEQDVTVTNTGFSPQSLTIKIEDSVTWTNTSTRTVYVAPDEHPSHQKYAGIWDDDGTGSIAPDESYTVTFSQAGTYTYHDHLSSTLIGTIIVTE